MLSCWSVYTCGIRALRECNGLCLIDKLHETKRRDAEIKAAAKNKRDEEKEKKRQEKVAERAVFREERAMTGSHSRRAHKDAREVMLTCPNA